ncbi:hypothetical protein AB6A40_004703 [Gnathostoma spinigerum]|uniref:HTH CENPB-type domain-containing protein n=1 Tax=Gnathostoma spinigerum TaxID=75299 RepID=A0ABD6EIL0_9BILA
MLSASPHRSEHESSCCTKRCCAMFSGPHSAVIKDEPSSPSPAFEKNVHGSASSHAQVDCTVSDSVSSDVPVSSSSLPRRSLRAVRPPRVASPVSFSSSTSFKKTRASKSGVPSRVLKKPEASSSSAKTSSRRLEGVSTTVCNQTNVLEESRSTRKETTLALKVRKNAVEKKDFHSKFPVFRTRPLTLTAVKAEVEDNETVEAEESLKGQKALRRSQRRGKRSFIERFKTPSNSVRKESKSSANDDGTSVRKAGDFDEFSGSVAMKPELLVEDIVENSATATSSQILLPGNCSSSTSTSFAVSCTPSSFSSSPEHSVTPDTYYCLQAYSPLPFPAVYESCTPEFLNMRSAITALLELDKLFPQPDCNPPPSMTFEAELLDMIERNQMQTQNPWLELTEQEIMEMIEKHKLRYPPPDVDTRKAGILSMKDKLDIFDRYERGEDIASIARYHAIAPSRVISIVKSAWSVNDRTGTLMPMSSNQKGPGYHHMALEKLEKILVKWMKEENRHVFMSQSAVQAKALEIWADLQKAGEGSKLSFTASRGWFSRFRRRARLFKLRSGCWSTENPRQFPARTNHIFENVVPEPSDGSISENMSQIMPTAVSGTVFEVSSDADEEKQVTHLPLHEVLSAIISSSRSDSNSTIYVQRDLIDEPITAILRPQCPPDTLSSFNHSSLSPLPRDHSAAEVQTDVKSESDDIMEEIFNAVIDRKPEVTSCGEPEACNTSDVMEYVSTIYLFSLYRVFLAIFYSRFYSDCFLFYSIH